MKNRHTLAALVIAATGTMALADSIDVDFLGSGAGISRSYIFMGESFTNHIGQFRVGLSNGEGPLASPLNGTFSVYCVEPDEILSGQDRYDVMEPEVLPLLAPADARGFSRAAAAENLFGAFGAQALDVAVSNDFAAAFNIALWEITFDYDPTAVDDNLDIFGGDIAFVEGGLSQAILDLVDQFLASIDSGSGSDVLGFVNNPASGAGKQDFLTSCTDGLCDDPVIPLPSVAGMGLAGIGLVGLRRRRP